MASTKIKASVTAEELAEIDQLVGELRRRLLEMYGMYTVVQAFDDALEAMVDKIKGKRFGITRRTWGRVTLKLFKTGDVSEVERTLHAAHWVRLAD